MDFTAAILKMTIMINYTKKSNRSCRNEPGVINYMQKKWKKLTILKKLHFATYRQYPK